ncbi:MAG: phosphoribosylamine--glycine ligase [Patescibacteria group bacterium]
MKKVLIVGKDGRAHALALACLRTSGTRVWMAPGNPGTEILSESSDRIRNVPIEESDFDSLARFAKSEKMDLTVVSAEQPYVDGIVDHFFEKHGLPIFGPTKEAARLEGSKSYAKDFMRENNIPTADYWFFEDYQSASEFVKRERKARVTKADGLASGKGVSVCDSEIEAEKALRRMMVDGEFGEAGKKVVIEERLSGKELSVHAICHGHKYVLLPVSQDRKALFDGERLVNTGGLGAIAPVPWVTAELMDQIEKLIIKPTLRGMIDRHCPFTGCLYCGLMITDNGPMLLEYNIRFGDPEAEVILPLIKSDFTSLLIMSIGGGLEYYKLKLSQQKAVGVVLASGGYPHPDKIKKGLPIDGLSVADQEPGTIVHHAGTEFRNGRIVTAGGRVFTITGLGLTFTSASHRVYKTADLIRFEDKLMLSGIGSDA